jgi:hypothetical protein
MGVMNAAIAATSLRTQEIPLKHLTETELLAHIEQHCEVREGFPRLDWDEIARFIEENYEEAEQDKAWDIAKDVWLKKTGEVLGDSFRVSESDNFLVLTSGSASYVKAVLKTLEYTLSTILKALDGIADDDGSGKYVAIIFDTMDEYYLYISDFYPEEGEFAGSWGVYLDSDYYHFALLQFLIDHAAPMVARGITLACLGHLPIPLWLNEGIAEGMEQEIGSRRDTLTPGETIFRHQRFWNVDNIQQFWSGDSWCLPDEGNELSYHLARLAVAELSRSYRKFKKFVLLADWQDGGEAASQKVLGASLGTIMEQFLGPGDWSPTPEKWPERDQADTLPE